MKESIVYHSVRLFGLFVRCLPLPIALGVGKFIGLLAYYFDTKHKSIAYGNLKVTFAQSKSPNEIKRITKTLFKNYGQNLIELLRMPLLNQEKFNEMVKAEGKEHVDAALKKGKGCILLAMHFGSWEMASVSAAMLGHPYKFFVRTQDKHTRLNDLLNEYRACGGSVVISRGSGTRDMVKAVQNNEIVGMVVDQGGKDGVLVPFFERQASMSVGAIRMALKWGVPICFAIIIREGGGKHRMIMHKPFEITKTGDMEKDIVTNLKKVVEVMEKNIRQYPSDYMWFYKIWKYSKEANITTLLDDKTGHTRQTETVTKLTQQVLEEKGITSYVHSAEVRFKNKAAANIFHVLSLLLPPLLSIGRLEILKWLLTKDSFKQIMSSKADYIVSCGSKTAGVNHLLAQDHHSKSIVILKPGPFSYKKFDLVVLPQHDVSKRESRLKQIAVTQAAPNLIDEKYLKEQSKLLLNRFAHLQKNTKLKIGLFVGGNSKNIFLSESQMKVLINQLREVSKEINADIIATTSRRTPAPIEKLLYKELKKDPLCPLLILANKENVPEAVGGILGLADIAVVSGDSISMVSEAASSGKYTVVFSPQKRDVLVTSSNKHLNFIENLNAQGFILSSHVKDIGQSIYSIAMNKIQTRKIDDNQVILEALRYII